MPETPEISDAARLLAKGSRVTLANGAEAEIVLTVPVLMAIEERYGSIEGFTEAWSTHVRGKIFGHLAFLFSETLGVSHEEAVELIDSKRLAEYMEAVVAALNEALPQASAQEVVAAGGNGRAARGGFRGAAGSGSRSRSTTFRPNSSAG